MGEINIKTGNVKQRRKVHSTKVDLTPMVDLGFLLITFFIFTTSMKEPSVVKMAVPDERTDQPNKAEESKTLNFMAAEKNVLWTYPGTSIGSIKSVPLTEKAVREQIQLKKTELRAGNIDPRELIILIKPLPGSTYENVVDLLDEMLINEVKRYVLMDPSPEEMSIITDVK